MAGTEGHEVLLTRTERTDASNDDLKNIVNMSNNFGADVFVSIHCNSFSTPAPEGTETWHFPGSAAGMDLAQHIQRELLAELGRKDRGVRMANYFVIRYTYAPAALVELAFISNPEEEQLLADHNFQYNAAVAIWKGVKSYLGITTKEPENTHTDEIQAPQEQPPQPIESREDWSDAGLRNRMSERG
jgi:N-acetylmuramoyl-L-alanine amidase